MNNYIKEKCKEDCEETTTENKADKPLISLQRDNKVKKTKKILNFWNLTFIRIFCKRDSTRFINKYKYGIESNISFEVKVSAYKLWWFLSFLNEIDFKFKANIRKLNLVRKLNRGRVRILRTDRRIRKIMINFQFKFYRDNYLEIHINKIKIPNPHNEVILT